jgi:radical SAM superfamily enzyme YgiQ (UPF0313 family)
MVMGQEAIQLRVTLVSPPSSVEERYPEGHPLRHGIQVMEPLGLAYVAAMLETTPNVVAIIDSVAEGLDFKAILGRIVRQHPDMVEISAVTPNFHAAMTLAECVKRECSDSIIVVGGIHPTVFPEQTLENPSVDYVVTGEGEHVLHNLVSALEGSGDVDEIRGLAYRKAGQVIVNPPPESFPTWTRYPCQHDTCCR